ncbi:hypothetical protein [Comamonas resistens]|uniref:Histidine kinase n=1 Tax=Comamonas resistens TaxID=3046670 RepID=A0ABY8SXD2_9BURK|nr:hypothetical protein [Comamonas resistens]MDL5038893.1 hypothetical protein [Comamonas resistens]WHS67705.1 hypothetical protein QMY55_11560 [Comamonas resistens]
MRHPLNAWLRDYLKLLRHYCTVVQQLERDVIALVEQAVQASVLAAQQAGRWFWMSCAACTKVC